MQCQVFYKPGIVLELRAIIMTFVLSNAMISNVLFDPRISKFCEIFVDQAVVNTIVMYKITRSLQLWYGTVPVPYYQLIDW